MMIVTMFVCKQCYNARCECQVSVGVTGKISRSRFVSIIISVSVSVFNPRAVFLT